MSQRKYVSLDPGWAVRDPDGTFRHGVFEGEDHHLDLWKFLQDQVFRGDLANTSVQIICEKFNYQRRQLDKGVNLVLISRNYIGIVELFSQMYAIPLYMSQVANKEFFNNKNLRDLNLYYPTEHERDAVSHLLWYLTNIEKDHQYLQVKR